LADIKGNLQRTQTLEFKGTTMAEVRKMTANGK
jgi:hypothetical protein